MRSGNCTGNGLLSGFLRLLALSSLWDELNWNKSLTAALRRPQKPGLLTFLLKMVITLVFVLYPIACRSYCLLAKKLHKVWSGFISCGIKRYCSRYAREKEGAYCTVSAKADLKVINCKSFKSAKISAIQQNI